MVRAARERGAAVLFATHDVGRAVELADRALVLQRGRVVLDDPAVDPEAVRRTYDAAAAGRDARAAGRDAAAEGRDAQIASRNNQPAGRNKSSAS